ncbi:MAG TPA: membrane dipeptidase, partial [Acidobacteriota bacterium]|nr:membrane dipeptidase [Acidobacteriota bacterium]
TPGWERNMDDEMIRRLAENGGVIQINFGSSFLRDDYRRNSVIVQQKLRTFRESRDLSMDAPEVIEMRQKLLEEYPPAYADISDVVRHIEHVVNLVGVQHVGIGSDFDGVGDSLPYGLKDVSQYPNLIYELLKKGFTEEEISLILSENTLRVWSEVEAVAKRLQSES